MRHFTFALLGFAAGAAIAIPAVAAPERCVLSRKIASIKYVDPHTVTVEMQNGTMYSNTLRTACKIHRFEGFAYRTTSGHLCKGDRIRAIRDGKTCTLGNFEKTG